VFCFTPKGTLIALPRGATTIDFAYAVHTDVGNTAVGAKINGIAAPMMSELRNGDEVEILRAEGASPPAAWETLVVTGKARASIRRATRDAVRKQYSGLGRKILDRAFERAGKVYSEDRLKAALPRLSRASIDDVLADIGRGELAANDVVRALYPDFRDERVSGPAPDRNESGWFGLKKAASLVFKVPGPGAPDNVHALPIRGLRGDLPVTFAPEGGAVPGDRIVGIMTPGEGITIYPIQSQALVAFEDQPDRWLDVRWDIDPERKEHYPARLAVTALHEPGALAEIAGAIGENGGNIENVTMVSRSADFREMLFDLEVWDLKQLTAIIARLRASKLVNKVERVND
jgi:GTP diphosphokinase / guanosine-3',5'-bis(diphosphate) 3'-diphosphatase